ncbi:D-amino acid dehydrogenase [Roseivivax halodurans JCM 10272]|uniref:D-amino acid dehydrogenase n=1 Tax=Roseivivax halodurans JCM 10272 TaxID=1449350 RepID=X7ECS3_9RHOB|nr:FAD-binding oxidoreductase [Roseivivax halodurans]ETX13700.1 D-amino acid dehydrogenase [Roseivivax halodurans JCM 10272]
MSYFLVLGAGMIGVSTALELQSRGHVVTLVDRRAPGQETSFGNAGVIQAEAAEPYALPRDLPTLLKYALGRSNDVTWSVSGVLRMAPALWSYFRHSAPARHRRIAQVYTQLTRCATEDHAPLIMAAGADNLIIREGMTLVYRDVRALDAAAREAERMRQSYGVSSRVLDTGALKAEEPALTGEPAGAIHMLQSWSCSDPGGLTAAYAELFRQRGGRIVEADALTLSREGSSWNVYGPDGGVSGEQVVVALGPWSPELLRRFGIRISMIYKRGYHAHYHAPRALRRPMLDTDCGIVAASMRGGLRLSSGAALVDLGAVPLPRQLGYGATKIGELFETGPRIDEPQWTGTRPCMPDMLPVVGPAPGLSNMWLNFGHGHHGFTLGPTSARVLADAISGDSNDLIASLALSDR